MSTDNAVRLVRELDYVLILGGADETTVVSNELDVRGRQAAGSIIIIRLEPHESSMVLGVPLSMLFVANSTIVSVNGLEVESMRTHSVETITDVTTGCVTKVVFVTVKEVYRIVIEVPTFVDSTLVMVD